MAFKQENLTVHAYGNGHQLLHYRTEDAIADISNTGYFDPAINTLDAGDTIVIESSIEDTPNYAQSLRFVKSADAETGAVAIDALG